MILIIALGARVIFYNKSSKIIIKRLQLLSSMSDSLFLCDLVILGWSSLDQHILVIFLYF